MENHNKNKMLIFSGFMKNIYNGDAIWPVPSDAASDVFRVMLVAGDKGGTGSLGLYSRIYFRTGQLFYGGVPFISECSEKRRKRKKEANFGFVQSTCIGGQGCEHTSTGSKKRNAEGCDLYGRGRHSDVDRLILASPGYAGQDRI